jgi:hypothetical protein
VETIKELSGECKNILFGIRMLLMSKTEIHAMRNALTAVRNCVHPDLIWMDFIRTANCHGTDLSDLKRVMGPFFNTEQYCAYHITSSLKPEVVRTVLNEFRYFPVTYDRFPDSKLLSKPDRVTSKDLPRCYIRPDEAVCIHGVTPTANPVCPGKLLPDKSPKVKQWVESSGVCKNLTNMDSKLLMSTNSLWRKNIYGYKQFAYGSVNSPVPIINTQRVLKTLFFDGLPQHYGFTPVRFLKAPDGRTLDLSKVK